MGGPLAHPETLDRAMSGQKLRFALAAYESSANGGVGIALSTVTP